MPLLPYILSCYAAATALTFLAYAFDKRHATRGQRRIPERHLHLLELLGGWPGALIAQSLIRHKRRKLSYMLVFWAIVLLHAAAWTAAFWLRV